MDRPLVSIIIPCFNEEESIKINSGLILDYVQPFLTKYRFELVLVNDGSTDQTGSILDSLVSKKIGVQVSVVHFGVNQGRGAAIKAGIKASHGHRVLVLDADLTYDVQHIGEIIAAFEKDSKIDVVVISPYMKGGTVRNVTWGRLLISRMANWILSGFFDNKISTVTCVVRGYNGPLLRSLPLFENGKELHLEILRKFNLRSAKILEIPGRLIWKKTRRRSNNLKVFKAAKAHLLYGLLVKPTFLLYYVGLFLVSVGFYELAVISVSFFKNFHYQGDFWQSLWFFLASEFAHSPHSFFITGLGLILGLQTLSFLALFQVLKLQQEESLKLLLAIYDERRTSACAE